MKTNLEALKAVYVKNGGSLTDTYEDIAGGAPVSAYKTLKDAIAALSKLTLGGGLPETPEDGVIMTAKDGEWLAITENQYSEDGHVKRYSELIPQEVPESTNNIYVELSTCRDYDVITGALTVLKNGYLSGSTPSIDFKNSDKTYEGETFRTISWSCINRAENKYSCYAGYTAYPKVNKYYRTPSDINTAISNALVTNATAIISSTSTVKTSIDVTDSDFVNDITALHSTLMGDDSVFYSEAPIRGIDIIGLMCYCTAMNSTPLGGKFITATPFIANFSGTWLKAVIALEILSDKISIHVFTDKV